jgi:hypothetical protein
VLGGVAVEVDLDVVSWGEGGGFRDALDDVEAVVVAFAPCCGNG